MVSWTRHDSGVMCGLKPALEGCTRAYIFDLENTLIVVKKGHPWKWWHASVPDKLRDLANAPGNLILISHDAKRNSDENSVLSMVAEIVVQLGIPVCVLVTFHGQNAKPRTHTWDLFASQIMPECLHHLVVGHAQQKLMNLKFATNLGCPYKTPQEFFLNGPLEDLPRLKNWSEWLSSQVPLDSSKWGPRQQQELVLLVGRPVSGKTTLANHVFHRYTILSLDESGTIPKLVKATKCALADGASVVIDAPNATVAERRRYISCATTPVRALVISVADDVANQLNAYREACGGKRVPTITINNYFSKYEAPTLEEGICEIHTATSFIAVPMHKRALFCTHW